VLKVHKVLKVRFKELKEHKVLKEQQGLKVLKEEFKVLKEQQEHKVLRVLKELKGQV
jgi:hypothetical protein